MNHPSTEWIFSYADWAASLAAQEIEEAGGALIKVLGPTTALAMFRDNWIDYSPPTFIRHRYPVFRTFARSIGPDAIVDAVVDAVVGFPDAWTHSWSFQIQEFTQGLSGKREIAERATSKLSSQGIELDRKSGAMVLSLGYDGERCFVGLSSRLANLSPWAGGEARYRQDASMISRSEMKLLESRDVFGVPVASDGIALDLGAAPGGWTRVLLDAGYTVIAVDPGPLDPRLNALPRLTQVRKDAEEYLFHDAIPHLSLIVNDMKAGGEWSAQMMARAGQSLCKGGAGIMTVKINSDTLTRVWGELESVRGHLSPIFEIVQSRHLFHNRQEITLLLRRV